MNGFQMVNSPDSTGVIIIGGYDNTSLKGYRSEVLELYCETSVDSCRWKTILWMKDPRENFIAIPVNRDILKCEE